jgi:hypothetical protein
MCRAQDWATHQGNLRTRSFKGRKLLIGYSAFWTNND